MKWKSLTSEIRAFLCLPWRVRVWRYQGKAVQHFSDYSHLQVIIYIIKQFSNILYSEKNLDWVQKK